MAESQSIRLLREQFNRRPTISATALPGQLASAPAGQTQQDITDFESKINAPDYPKELREAYFLSKSKGDFTNFNKAVETFNTEQQAKAQKFEKAVQAPDYPAELKTAYQQAKDTGDYAVFNTAVKAYNDKRQADIADFEKKIESYPDVLKKAYFDSKDKGDYTGFNEAVKAYNEKQAAIRKEYETREAVASYYGEKAIEEAEEKAINDIAVKYNVDPAEIEKLADTLKKNPDDPSLTNNEVLIQAVNDIAAIFPNIPSVNIQKFRDNAYETINVSGKPEYILKTDYANIFKESPQLAELLKTKGIEALSAAAKNINERELAEYQKALAEYNKLTVKNKDIIDKLISQAPEDPELMKLYTAALMKNDFTEYNQAVDAFNAKADIQNKKFFEWLRKEAPRHLYYTYTRQGRDALDAAINKYYKEYNEALKEVSPYITNFVIKEPPAKTEYGLSGDGTPEKTIASIKFDKKQTIDVEKYIRDRKDEKYLVALGVPESDIKEMKHYIASVGTINDFTLDYFERKGWDTRIPTSVGDKTPSTSEIKQFQSRYDEAVKAYYDTAPEKKPGSLAKEFALNMVPILGTVRYAKSAATEGWTAGEIAMLGASIATDILTLIPVLGQVSAAARGTFMGVKAGQYISRAVQLREFGKAAGYITLGELKAPFTMLAHPIETAKVALSPLETLARWELKIGNKALVKAKIPLSAVESKWNTMRIPISMVGKDAKTAMELRDSVTRAMVRGESNTATIRGWDVELNPAAINRLGEPLAISATPDVRPYVNGATIGKGAPVELADGRTVVMGEGRDLYLAPTMHSRFAEASATGMIPKDAVPGAIILRGEGIIKELESSAKTYKGTAEIESVIKASKKFKLGKPVQTLITRTPYGKKLTLLVFGKPFTTSEIAALKFTGSADTLAQIFRIPVKINGKSAASFVDAETGFAGSASRNGFRVPIRVITGNYTNYDLFGNYRRFTGDRRKNIVLENDDLRRTLESRRKSPRIGLPRPPVARMAVPRQGERTPPGLSRRRPDISDKRGVVIPEQREVLEPGRRTAPEPPGRITPQQPKRRLPPGAERSIPIIPDRKTPLTLPPQRIPPPAPPSRGIILPDKARYLRLQQGTDSEKRKFIKNSGGAFAWRQGAIGGKDRWDTIVNPYESNEQYLMVLGAPPEGATILSRGKGSAKATAQMLRGVPPKRRVTVDSGFQDVEITAAGQRLMATWTPDPKGLTKSDITIGGNKPRITERQDMISKRMPPISKRGTRISGKMPRLR